MRDSGWDRLPPDVRFAGKPAEMRAPPWITIRPHQLLTEIPSCEAGYRCARPTFQIITFGLQRAAGPYKRATSCHQPTATTPEKLRRSGHQPGLVLHAGSLLFSKQTFANSIGTSVE